MRKIGITADCSSGLEYAPFEHDIRITRTTIHFGDETLVDGIDITAEGFYEKLKNTDVVPSTSAPAPKEILDRIEELKNEGCTDIIHFPISYCLSAYGENLESSMEDFVEDVNFKVINSNSACLMEGYVAKYAEVLANKGYSVEEIIEEIPNLRDKINAYFVVDDLTYLHRGGRVSGVSKVIGNMLGIKPILHFDDEGKILNIDKVKGKKKALAQLIEYVRQKGCELDQYKMFILEADCRPEAEAFAEQLKAAFGDLDITIQTIGPVIGAHCGPGTIGLIFHAKER